MSEQQQTEAKTQPGSGYRYLVLAMLILAYTFNFLDRQILGILAKPIKDEFGLTDAQFGLMGGRPSPCSTRPWPSRSPGWPTVSAASGS